MTTPTPYIEALERALGRIIAQSNAEAQRQVELFAARCDAAIAGFREKQTGLDARIASIDGIVSDRVEAGIVAGLGEVEARLREELRPDDAPLAALQERLASVEARGDDVAALAQRVEEVEARDAEVIARGIVDAAIAEMPPPQDWTAEIEAVRAEIPEPAEAPDLSGFATREDLAEVRAAMPEIPEQRDWTAEIEAVRDAANEIFLAAKAEADQVFVEVRERLARHPGVFPKLREWADGVHYAGDVVVFDGSTWQARQDTGKAPPHEDWSCIAARGKKGGDGRSFVVRGTYNADETYSALDVVILDGSSFVARQDDPGDCPGEGWQLATSRGGRGRPGDKGDPGRPGKDADPVVAMEISDDGVLTLTNGDGSTAEADLYPILARVSK